MGNDSSSTQRPQQVSKVQIEIVLAKVKNYVMLERDRKIETLKKQEGKLLEITQKKSYEITELRTNAVSIINNLKWIKGANIVLVYVKQLAEHTIALERGQKDPSEIVELIPGISTVIWATGPLNLAAIQEFNHIVTRNFSKKLTQEATAGERVDNQLKKNFSNLIPTAIEFDEYIKGFLSRHKNQIDDANKKCLMDSVINLNKNFGGKFGAPPSQYDPSSYNPNGDTTIAMSTLPDPMGQINLKDGESLDFNLDELNLDDSKPNAGDSKPPGGGGSGGGSFVHNQSQQPGSQNFQGSQQPGSQNFQGSQHPGKFNGSQQPGTFNQSQQPGTFNGSQQPGTFNGSQQPGSQNFMKSQNQPDPFGDSLNNLGNTQQPTNNISNQSNAEYDFMNELEN